MKRQAKTSPSTELTLTVDTSDIQGVLTQLENEIAAYQQDAERYIWLRDYSPLSDLSTREQHAAELDELCDEGLRVQKAASNPTQ